MIDFWKIVDDAEYSSTNFDHNASRAKLLKKGYSKLELSETLKEMYLYMARLNKSYLKSNHHLGLGDDSLNDFFAYIISRGESEFMLFINKPSEFKKYDHESFAPENFIYTFLTFDN